MVLTLSRENTVGPLDATVFKEIRDLIPFFVDIIPVCFKIFVIISLFNFLPKDGEKIYVFLQLMQIPLSV